MEPSSPQRRTDPGGPVGETMFGPCDPGPSNKIFPPKARTLKEKKLVFAWCEGIVISDSAQGNEFQVEKPAYLIIIQIILVSVVSKSCWCNNTFSLLCIYQ